MSAEIKDISGATAVLTPGGGGIFEVRRDGELLFSKGQSGRFPDPGEMLQLLD